jgi:isopentenyl-diphosphate delta-isomerase
MKKMSDLNKVKRKSFAQYLSKIDKGNMQIYNKNILKTKNVSQENNKVEKIILVDERDNIVGHEEKMKAHENGGKLHRAFSIFIFNNKGEMLIQQRSLKKYHFGGLWTNTCCSHPNEDETLKDATYRKLNQEFGFNTNIKEKFSFIYKETDENYQLTEHEFDHVLTGEFNGNPQPNPEEIDDFKWISVANLKQDIAQNPEKYTPWFKIAISKFDELNIPLQK